IDVGCGNGILSCYLALRFPDAHISGFDISKEGIECAIKLAQKLNLKNTDFIVADAHCQDDKLDSRKADLIISVASLGLSQSESDDGVESSIYERYQKDSAKMRSTALELIASRLDENSGMFVSFDKVKDARAQISWAAQIQNSHLAIDIENCNWIRYVDIESETISLPVFVCRKETNIKKAGYNELIAFLLTDEERCTDLMIEGDQGLFAETIFSRLSPRQFIKGARAEYHDGGGTYWCEIWQAGPFLLTFEHTNHGYRTLKSHSLLRRTECLEAFKTWVDDSRKYADVKLLESPDISFELKSESDVEA
ncbi:MAG: class I SAM-dependent methyltransferase, partial [Candidatus Obscuribacterales bacterium]|nr:class I SAM-dependent methyltransferase [Candidatus Obscuribacterales bacterium]